MSEQRLHVWEEVVLGVERLRVPGGWIYKGVEWAVFVPAPPRAA